MSAPALQLRELTVSFGRFGTVLDGVDLRMEEGSALAVVGESGAGKSVLARALIGLAGEGGVRAAVTAAEFTLAGRDALGFGERDWRKVRGRDVGFVLQDALQSLDPLRTIGAEVGESIAIRHLGRTERRARVLEAMERAGLRNPDRLLRQRSGELSGGMRQRALIAAATVDRPALLIADEPTTALDATVAAEVLAMLAELRDAGTAILLVTHDLHAVSRLAEEVVVLDAGRVVERAPTARLLGNPEHAASRRLVAAVPVGPKPQAVRQTKDGANGVAEASVVLEAKRVSRSYRVPGGHVDAVDEVSLSLHAGEALGIVGESGSGKSTLARLLVAAEAPDRGVVELTGERWNPLPERQRRARRGTVRFVPQDPLGSFDPRLRVRGILRDAARSAGRDTHPERLLELVHLPISLLDRAPRSLSGGQRQRVAIARALAAEPRILVCDEPVSALDVGVQAAVLELLAELQQRGIALVFISHDLAVVRRVCDTVAVMTDGRIVEYGEVEQVWASPQHPVTKALLAASSFGATGSE